MQYLEHYSYTFKVFAHLRSANEQFELSAASYCDEAPVTLTMAPFDSDSTSPANMENIVTTFYSQSRDYPPEQSTPAAIVDFLRAETATMASRYGWRLLKFDIAETPVRSYIVEFIAEEQLDSASPALYSESRTSGIDGLSYDAVTPAVKNEVNMIISRLSKHSERDE